MKRSTTYTPELRAEAVELVLTQGLTLDEAARRLSIPKGTLGNWVVAAKRGTTPKVAPGSRSVHAWESSTPSEREQEDERLKVAIQAVHMQSRETYGPLRMQPELADQGFVAGRGRIARLRRELGVRCKQKRKFKATTNSNHDLPVFDNLLNQNSLLLAQMKPG